MPFGLLVALKAAHLFLGNRFTQACARSDNMNYCSLLDIVRFCDPESWFCFILSSIRFVSFAETSGRFCGCQNRWFWFAACVWHTLIGITQKVHFHTAGGVGYWSEDAHFLQLGRRGRWSLGTRPLSHHHLLPNQEGATFTLKHISL